VFVIVDVYVIGVYVDVIVGVLVGVRVGVGVGVLVGVAVLGARGMPAEASRMLKESNNNIMRKQPMIFVDRSVLLLINYLPTTIKEYFVFSF
jgi:hypothetical protein